MSLSTSDLEDIRLIVREETTIIVRDEVRSSINSELTSIKDELEMLRNDIKEIYYMIAGLQNFFP